MSVPGLRSGTGHNPHVRMPASVPGLRMVHEKIYTEDTATVKKDFKKVRVRGRVMGTPGKIPGDVYANVIKAKQRSRRKQGAFGFENNGASNPPGPR